MTRSVQRPGPAGDGPPSGAGPAGSSRVTLRAVGAVLLVLLAVAVMVRLSLWQWDRARASGRFLNYTYAVEWLLFAVLTLAGLVRLGREGRRLAEDSAPAPTAGGPVVGPPLVTGEELPDVTWVRILRRLGMDRSG